MNNINNKFDEKSIKELLEKYFDAETSLEEESQLRMYFKIHADALPSNLQKYSHLFGYLNQEKARISGIKSCGVDGEREVSKSGIKSANLNKKTNFWFAKNWIYISAAAVLLIGMIFIIGQKNTHIDIAPDKVLVESNAIKVNIENQTQKYQEVAIAIARNKLGKVRLAVAKNKEEMKKAFEKINNNEK